MIRKAIGVLIILAAIGGGIYFGVWECFIQAIIEIIEAIKSGWIAKDIAIGVAKIIFGGPLVEFAAYMLAMVGMGLAIPGRKKRK